MRITGLDHLVLAVADVERTKAFYARVLGVQAVEQRPGHWALAVGRNRRIQMGSSIRHGETDCIENAGRLSARTYRASTLYTTLSPCFMCAGTAVLYDIPRIVIGENRTFEASESWLASRGVELVIADDAECRALMDKMIAEKPELWAEDIGEEA